jgi:hypothetical protein
MVSPLETIVNFQDIQVVYNESDYGNLDDEAENDDGLNIYPATSSPPTRRQEIRSQALDVAPTTTEEIDNDDAAETPQDPVNCIEIPMPPPDSFVLSANFTLGSVSTQTALSRQQVRPQAGLRIEDIVCNLQGWAQNVGEPIAATYGRANMLITSGFRPGSGTSQHERGQACDIQFPKMTNTQIYDIAVWIRDYVAYDQLILEYGGNRPWIHCSFNRAGNRAVTASNKFGTRVSAGSYVWRSLRNMS